MPTRLMTMLATVAILLGSSGLLRADSPGQKHLDEALKLKLTASDVVQLGQVIRLCDQALKAGLEKEDQTFCNTLLTGALLERGVLIGRVVLKGAVRGPLRPEDVQQLVQLRAAALADLERAVKLNPRAAEGHLNIGRLNALPGGDKTRAVTALSTAILLHPENPDELGQAYLTRAQLVEDPKQQLSDYNAAVKALPENAAPLRARSVFYLEQNDAKKCLADADAALKIEPQDARSHEIRGMALDTLKRYEPAAEAYSKAIDLAANPLTAYLRRARVYLRQDKGKDAIRDINKILAQQEPTPGLLLLRASAYEVAGDRNLALEDVQSALKLQPDMPQALRARATLRAGSGNVADAIGDLEALVKVNRSDTEVLIQLGYLYLSNKQSQRAIETFTSAIKQDSKNGEAYRARGDGWLRIGKHAEAVADYQETIKSLPNDTHVLNNLAWLLATSPDAKVRDADRAIELAKKACELTQYKQGHILSTLAASYAEKGDFATAIKWSKKAVEMGEGDIREQLKQELKSYQQGKPWREESTTEDGEQ